jgi:hypothetical protein
MELLRSLKKQLTKLQLMISKLNLKLKALKLLLNNFIIFEELAILKPWCVHHGFFAHMQLYVVFFDICW